MCTLAAKGRGVDSYKHAHTTSWHRVVSVHTGGGEPLAPSPPPPPPPLHVFLDCICATGRVCILCSRLHIDPSITGIVHALLHCVCVFVGGVWLDSLCRGHKLHNYGGVDLQPEVRPQQHTLSMWRIRSWVWEGDRQTGLGNTCGAPRQRKCCSAQF